MNTETTPVQKVMPNSTPPSRSSRKVHAQRGVFEKQKRALGDGDGDGALGGLFIQPVKDSAYPPNKKRALGEGILPPREKVTSFPPFVNVLFGGVKEFPLSP